ncbi:tail fiber assembly protein [Yersinia frederiksenii]|uniref:tail fiber assembly protein n=1 Tax=Yersinia frederiksenii TaxID=29484 RepID=UPI0011A3B945|nr:tail fiber assembly protein [Yersinia frederiksenii]
MVIYGKVGESLMETWPDDMSPAPQDGYIQMKSERPGNDYYATESGEWLKGPSPAALQLIITEAATEKSALLSHASDMIGALSDEIEGLENNDDDVPEKLRNDLKAWKQYRVMVKNIDVSLAPDIEWPAAPE